MSWLKPALVWGAVTLHNGIAPHQTSSLSLQDSMHDVHGAYQSYASNAPGRAGARDGAHTGPSRPLKTRPFPPSARPRQTQRDAHIKDQDKRIQGFDAILEERDGQLRTLQ